MFTIKKNVLSLQAGVKGTLGRLVGVFEVTLVCLLFFSLQMSTNCCVFVNENWKYAKTTCFPLLQNQERKHRTYVYVLIVTEVLEDWEDSVNIGKAFVYLSKWGSYGQSSQTVTCSL